MTTAAIRSPVTEIDSVHGVVFRSAGVECLFWDRGSDTLLVTFNEMGMIANGRRCWGDAPAEKLKLSLFGFVSARPNWFPVEEMQQVLPAFWRVVRASSHRRVVVIGLSQGGYAALKYHRMLGADVSIAFAPQISIDPKDVVDLRFNRYFDAAVHDGMRVGRADVSSRCFAFYDPFEGGDRKHGRLLEQLGSLRAIRLPFAGHAAVRSFLGSANLSRLIEACFARDDARIRALFAELKPANPDRPTMIAQKAAEKRPHVALAIFQKYAWPARDARWLHTCWRLGDAGLGADVIGWLRDFVAAYPKHASGRECLCLVAIRVGECALALALARNLCEEDPENPRRRYILALAGGAGRGQQDLRRAPAERLYGASEKPEDSL
jgi:hypothetical protein